jgi:hypothetical protein
MMHRIQRVSVAQTAKLLGLLYLLLGLLFAVIFGLFSSMMPGAAAPSPFFGIGSRIGSVILMPLLYGVLVVVFGALTAAFYNLAASWVGGLEIDLTPV